MIRTPALVLGAFRDGRFFTTILAFEMLIVRFSKSISFHSNARPRHTPPGRTALPVPPFSTGRTCPPPPMPQRRARQDQRSAPLAESRCFLNISCPFCNPRSRFLFLSFSDSFSDFSVVFSRCHRAAFSESHVVFQTPASRRAVQCCEAFKTEVS